ncbi:LOG family protein [Clavibacter sepedonicus]|uniref:LOG family protein n=1 Tax=Clavibacter TaxID=1573 RepID=UPI0018E11039
MKSIAVFCGASSGASPLYERAARELGRALVERGMSLVYGGASTGLMGTIADEVISLGGTVVGVIPDSLVRFEVCHRGLTELRRGRRHARTEGDDGSACRRIRSSTRRPRYF